MSNNVPLLEYFVYIILEEIENPCWKYFENKIGWSLYLLTDNGGNV